MRGMLTDKIQEKAVSFLNREIMQKELRLYPYIDYRYDELSKYYFKISE